LKPIWKCQHCPCPLDICNKKGAIGSDRNFHIHWDSFSTSATGQKYTGTPVLVLDIYQFQGVKIGIHPPVTPIPSAPVAPHHWFATALEQNPAMDGRHSGITHLQQSS
jgi:hypothetical protein